MLISAQDQSDDFFSIQHKLVHFIRNDPHLRQEILNNKVYQHITSEWPYRG